MLAITIILGIIAAAEISAVIFNHIFLARVNDRISEQLHECAKQNRVWQEEYNKLLQVNTEIAHENNELKSALELNDKKKGQE